MEHGVSTSNGVGNDVNAPTPKTSTSAEPYCDKYYCLLKRYNSIQRVGVGSGRPPSGCLLTARAQAGSWHSSFPVFPIPLPQQNYHLMYRIQRVKKLTARLNKEKRCAFSLFTAADVFARRKGDLFMLERRTSLSKSGIVASAERPNEYLHDSVFCCQHLSKRF